MTFVKSYVALSRYIDETGERPMLAKSRIPVATIAYRAMSGSWGLAELAYEFSLDDVEVLAALLYYEQFKERVDALEDADVEMDAMD